MPEVLVDGVVYVPRASIPQLADDRLIRCLESLIEIQYFNIEHKNRAIAWNALHALSPELAQLASDNPQAAYDRVNSLSADRRREPASTDAINPPRFSREDMLSMVPVCISDMKHSTDSHRKEISNRNIQYALYHHVIRSLYDENTFLHHEKEPSSFRVGTFVKGYVRDIWDYLGQAYDLIHAEDFVSDHQDLIAEGLTS